MVDIQGARDVRSYHSWAKERLEHGWQIIGVEVPFELALGEVLIRGFVDRVFSDENGVVRVVDIKTGSRSPASNLQLGCYSVGVAQALGISPTIGNYYMARNATLTPDASLLHYSPDLLEHWFGMAKRAIESEVFIPHVTSQCGTCTVAAHCTAVGGRAPLALSSGK
jgi:RecB family exonuclease